MISEIKKALEVKDWKQAAKLIKQELAATIDQTDPEVVHSLVYNLILCSIHLGKTRYARTLLKHNTTILTSGELKEFITALKGIEASEAKKDTTRIREGKIESMGFFTSTTTLKDVIGLERVKKYLKKSIIYQIRYPEKYRQMGAELSGGAVLYGPPGTGKTLIARAIAGEIGGRMLIMSLPDIINKYAGDSEKNIKKVFEEAKRKKPAIIFIDEIDGIGQKRENSDNDVGQGALMHNVITTLLTEIEGISTNMENVYTIATTNRPWSLDSALTRSGRISDKIYVPLPGLRARTDIFKYYMAKMPTQKMDYLKLGLLSFALSPADIKAVCQIAANEKASALIEGKGKAIITMNDIIKSIKQKREEVETIDWFAGALAHFKGKPKTELTQYKGLIKDIKFWYLKAPAEERRQKLLSLIL